MALHEQGLDGQSKTNESKNATVKANVTQNSSQNATETHQEPKKATPEEKE